MCYLFLFICDLFVWWMVMFGVVLMVVSEVEKLVVVFLYVEFF